MSAVLDESFVIAHAWFKIFISSFSPAGFNSGFLVLIESADAFSSFNFDNL